MSRRIRIQIKETYKRSYKFRQFIKNFTNESMNAENPFSYKKPFSLPFQKCTHDHYSESDPDELDDDPDASESLDELELNLPPDLLLSPAAPEAGPLAASAPPAF